MIDMKLIRTNPELVKENIKKKFQDEKLELVDKVVELDRQYRETKVECDSLRNQRKVKSKQIGGLMAKGQKDEAEKVKAEVTAIGEKLTEMEELEVKLEADVREIMLV
ncbi:MAG: serine--tRNA ligase, partial [Ruminococcus sp.]|nr:serine--tRNA ligase [Ruminococcus sp.]